MSDLCMYELEDIVWEEFGDNDDHIVPHTGGKNNGYGVESDSSKRPRYELTSTKDNVGSKSASNVALQRKEETRLCSVKKEKEIMLEKSPWPQSSVGAVSASIGGDPNGKAATSDEGLTSNQCMKSTNMDSTVSELHGDDPIPGDRTGSVDNLYRYQLNNAGHTEIELGLFGDNLQDKESSDLLYYMWPELENFEDVDKMFRSSDSTFGLEIDNDDELGWFSSSQPAEGSEDAFKSSFNTSASGPRGINNVAEHQEVYGHNDAGLVVDEIDRKLTSVSWERGLEKVASNGSSIVMNSSYSNGSGAPPNIKGDPQVCSYLSQSKNEKPSEGKIKEHSLGNGNSFLHVGNLKQESDTGQSLHFQCSLWAETQQQDVAPQACLRTPDPLINSNTVHPSSQVLARPRSSKIKSTDSRLPSLSPRESSYASTESSHDVSFQHRADFQNKTKEKLRLSRRTDKSNSVVQRADSDSISAQKQVPNFGNEVQGQSEVSGSDIGIPGELDSSNIQESSCMSSVLDEISIEATSFRQLQQVLEQLDVRTKLCIRDSLYRLARSAEQRHKCVNLTNISRDDKDPGEPLLADETNKSAGFMDMETDTNPIDRSIAHLLFHRPSEPSATAAPDAVAMKSPSMVETTSANVEPLKNECENRDN